MAGAEADFGPFAAEIFEDTYNELESRLTSPAVLVDLPEADRIAILTAISKAAWLGVLRGIAHAAFVINRKADEEEAADPSADVFRVDPQMHTDPVPDPWAQRYGSGS
jgi:hypothetical protein